MVGVLEPLLEEIMYLLRVHHAACILIFIMLRNLNKRVFNIKALVFEEIKILSLVKYGYYTVILLSSLLLDLLLISLS